MKGKTYVALILDKSGSMMSLRESAIQSFNDQLEALKEEAEKQSLESYLTLVTFNGDVEFCTENSLVQDVSTFPEKSYIPNGSTALFDAIALTIARFEFWYKLQEHDAVLFVIVTDGQENSSLEFSGEEGRKLLKEKIEKLTETGQWTFTFVGTENALDQAMNFGIFNTIVFDHTPESYVDTMGIQSNCLRSYYSARADGQTTVDDFYKPEEKEEEVEKTP